MDFSFKREQEILRRTVREFAENEIAPRVDYFDEPGEFPFETAKKMADLGLIGMTVPKEYGGSAMGHLARMIATEELARVYTAWGSHHRGFEIIPYLISTYGSDQQKEKYLRKLCKGELFSQLAITEQIGGSDPLGIQTTAKLERDEYVINGRKVFATRGEISDLIGVTAKTGEKSISTFLMEKGFPGFKAGRRERLISTMSRTMPINELIFDNCRVPRENMVGVEGKGLGPVLGAVGAIGRTGGAALCLGTSIGAFEDVLKYAKERVVAGRALSSIESIRFRLGDMAMRIDIGKLLNYKTGWLLDQRKHPREITKETASCKLYNSELAVDVILKAIEIFGGYGTSADFPIIRRMKSALDAIAAAGSNNIMRLMIANATVGESVA